MAEELEAESQQLLALTRQAEKQPSLWPDVVRRWDALLEKAADADDEVFLAEVRGNLANACTRLYEVTGDEQWAERATGLYGEVLTVFTRSSYPQAWGGTEHALGHLLTLRYERTGDVRHAKVAASRYHNALRVFRREGSSEDWAMVQHSQGGLLLSCYERSADEVHAQAAERHYRDALEVYVREAAPADWALEQHSLGTLFSVRYKNNRDEANARAAEMHYHNALEEFRGEVAPSNWAMVQHSLGNLYLSRYEHTGRKDYGQTAAIHYQNALKEYRREVDPFHWAGTHYSLGTLISRRYEDSKDEAHAEAAEDHYKKALQEYRRQTAPALWAMTQHALGNLFYYHYEQAGHDALAEAVETHYKNALKRFRRETAPAHWATVRHGLASLLSLRYERSGHHADAKAASRHYQAVLKCAQVRGLPPVYSFKANAGLARLSFRQADWPKTVRAYERSQGALEALLALQTLRAGKETWLAEAYGLSHIASYAYTALGHDADAVVALEAGRTRLLGEGLEENRRSLMRLKELGYEGLFKHFTHATRALDTRIQLQGYPPADWAQQLEAAREGVNEAIKAIQSVPEFSEFLKPLAFTQIAQMALERPLIYLSATQAGGLALVVSQERVWSVPMETVTDELINHWLIRRDAGGTPKGFLPAQVLDFPMRPALDELLPALGREIAGPLAQALRHARMTAVTLIPTGLLTLLPLHAAPYAVEGETRTLLDEFVVSYAPSALALEHCGRALASLEFDQPSLLAIGNPLPLPEVLPSLRFARAEAAEIAALFDGKAHALCGPEATKEAVEENLGAASYLHFACHGQFEPLDPLNSGLILSGGQRLTLGDLLERTKHLRARLVVLSACQTAITDYRRLPEEAIGLPAGFIQAGVPAVIGTLWPVDDLSTALLMIQFYRFHLESDPDSNQRPMLPAEALRSAQLWLRDMKGCEMKEYGGLLLAEAPTFPTSAQGDEALKRVALEDDESRPFAHPYYWAGFTFHGM